MKPHCLFPLLTAVALVDGCQTHEYRVVQPSGVAQTVIRQPVTFHYDSLVYRLARCQDRLALDILNPTEEHILLLGSRSSVIDPSGASHPLPGRVLQPHADALLLLPPVPVKEPYPQWKGWGAGWYDPFWDPFRQDPWYWPPETYLLVKTPFDWEWKSGTARLHLVFEREGQPLEQDLELTRVNQ